MSASRAGYGLAAGNAENAAVVGVLGVAGDVVNETTFIKTF